MKLLRVSILCLFVSAAFAQRGGSHVGGGFSRGGGGGGGFSRGGGGAGGFSRGGGGGFSRGFSGGGFRGGSSFSRGGFNRGFNRGYGGFRGGNRYAFAFGFGLGYPYYGYGYGWGYPYYSDYYYPYSYGYSPYAYTAYPSYYDSGYGSAPVIVNQTYSQPNPAPPPQVREYGQQSQQSGGETLYLIAFRDHRILAAVAYWVEGDTLHYVTREHQPGQIALDEVDRAFSEQLNRDRRVEFRLPR